MLIDLIIIFFFFNDTATTEIYTLSLHDALPIWGGSGGRGRGCAFSLRLLDSEQRPRPQHQHDGGQVGEADADRKSTRLNSSHANISYAVFCLKKKKSHRTHPFFCFQQNALRTDE